jgi:hypothetical protein
MPMQCRLPTRLATNTVSNNAVIVPNPKMLDAGCSILDPPARPDGASKCTVTEIEYRVSSIEYPNRRSAAIRRT